MSPLEVTQALFERFGAADVPGIMQFIHDDAVIDFYGPEVIPYAGHYEGRAQAEQFFKTVLSSVDIHVFEPEQMFGSSDRVAVSGHLHLTARSTGRDIVSAFAHIIRVQDEKWIHFQDFMNTVMAEQAFRA